MTPFSSPKAEKETAPPVEVNKRKYEIPEGNVQAFGGMGAWADNLRKIRGAVKEYEKDKGEGGGVAFALR